MALSNKREQDNNEFDKWLEDDDPFGLNEEIEEIVLFRCLDCKGTDKVPGFIIGEFSVDLNKGEEVELHCPHCNGTMIEARNAPSE